ncbi:MAG: carA [Gammaproteobacteria bacterium]|nr:carA [Gammaproteobacteria bacterium]
MQKKAILALADGTHFEGIAVGHGDQTVGEVVFNTAMTGYQEVLSDPSYAEQLITFTTPHIGNVGTNAADFEANKVYAKGFIVRELPTAPSSWRAQQSFMQFIDDYNLLGIAEIDTRALVHHLRQYGAQAGCILVSEGEDVMTAVAQAQAWGDMQGRALIDTVATQKTYAWQPSHHKTDQHTIVVVDFGVKQGILRHLAAQKCNVIVVPPESSADDILKLQPQGIVLSNGPGDPAACLDAIKTIQHLFTQNIPLFGICLGHQLLALALGAKTMKMKQGHHGANHPVQDVLSKRVFITSQNHGFAVDEATLPQGVKVTHRSLFDNTLQGFSHQTLPLLAFQGHPEASPGPNDISILFEQFIKLINAGRMQHA